MHCICGRTIGVLLVTLCAVLTLPGCEKPASPPVATQRPTPEESFKLIAEDFRRNVETTGPGLISRQGATGTTAIALNNTVTNELIAPPAAGEAYRGTITVTTRSRVSRVPLTSEDKNNRGEDAGSEDDTGTSGGSSLDSDSDASDPLSSGGSTSTGRAGRRGARGRDVAVMRPAEEVAQVYELVYRDDRWELVTAVNEKTDRAVKAAFDHALKTQL